MADDEIDEEQLKTSKFNSAYFINKRLDELRREVTQYVKVGDYFMWNLMLDRIWCELAGDIKEDGTEQQQVNKLNNEISNAGAFITSKDKEGFNKISDDKIKIMNKHYGILIRKEVFLIRLQYKQGKGPAYEDSAEAYMSK